MEGKDGFASLTIPVFINIDAYRSKSRVPVYVIVVYPDVVDSAPVDPNRQPG